MRLQAEAQAAGGQLHVVLGNHEAMNVLGDLRYVDRREYAAYCDLESAAVRAQAARGLAGSERPRVRRCFEQKFPPGTSATAPLCPRRTLRPMAAGRSPWRSSSTTRCSCMRGPRSLRGMRSPELNLRYRTALDGLPGCAGRRWSRRTCCRRVMRSMRGRTWPRNDWPRWRPPRAAPTPQPTLADGMSQRFAAARTQSAARPDGPNWYRGAALCNEVAESDVLLPLLQQFGAARLVIGHTPTRDFACVTRFDGRVIKLDAGMNRAAYKGRPPRCSSKAAAAVRYAGEPAVAPRSRKACSSRPMRWTTPRPGRAARRR